MKDIKLLKLTVCFTGFDFILHSRMADDFCRCYTWLCHVNGGFDGSFAILFCGFEKPANGFSTCMEDEHRIEMVIRPSSAD